MLGHAWSSLSFLLFLATMGCIFVGTRVFVGVEGCVEGIEVYFGRGKTHFLHFAMTVRCFVRDFLGSETVGSPSHPLLLCWWGCLSFPYGESRFGLISDCL